MANYPSSLPVTEAAGANLSTNPHSALHDDMYDEIVAIATELGTVPKGTYASVKARLDALPRGVIGYATASGTSQTGIGSGPTAITGLSVSFTAVAGRRYKATLNVSTSQNATGGNQTLYLTTDLATIRARSKSVAASTGAVSWCLVEQFTTTAGTRTVSPGAGVDAGEMTIVNDFSRNATLLIEDIGPS